MDATEALHLLRRLGLTVTTENGRLIVRPADLLDDDVRWSLRRYRNGIIQELQNNEPRWAWLVTFETHSREVYMNPEATHAEMAVKYPSAIRIVPLPECLWPYDAAKANAA